MKAKISSLGTLVFLFLVLFLFAGFSVVSAFGMRGGDGRPGGFVSNLPEGTMEEVRNIFSTGTYADLQNFLARDDVQQFLDEHPRLADKAGSITEGNFPLVKEMMGLKDQLQTLQEDLGLGAMKGMHRGKGERPTTEERDAMEAAIEAGDYNAWAEVAPAGMTDVITEENFGKFVEMHNIRTRMQEISSELGFPVGRGGPMMGGRGCGYPHGYDWEKGNSQEVQ